MTTKIKPHVRQNGGWALIGTQEASNDASLTQTGFDSTYDAYVVGLSNMIVGTNNAELYMSFGDSSGIDSGGSDYVYIRQIYNEGSTTLYKNITTREDILLGVSQGTGSEQGSSGMYWILNPGDAGCRNTLYGYQVLYDSGPIMKAVHIYGMREAAIVLDRILVKCNNGNIASGRMTVWGIAHT